MQLPRLTQLDDYGCADDPIGSVGWAKWITFCIDGAVKLAKERAAHVHKLVTQAESECAWVILGVSRSEYWQAKCGIDERVVEMLRTCDKNETIGSLLERRRAMVAEAKAEPLAEHRRPTKHEQASKPCNDTRFSYGDASHTLRRLARDGHEEMLSSIERGDLSPNAAAIQVGYRKPPRKKTPQEQLHAAIDRAARSGEIDWDVVLKHIHSKIR